MNQIEDENDCPICITIPTGKVFQCREGHIICELCLHKIQENAEVNSVPKCPSCAAPLDKNSVSRCRYLENMLDRLQIDCQHAKNGCPTKLKRGEAERHESLCLYGEGFKICSLFSGGEKCNFKLSVGTAETTMDHIKSSHPTVGFYGGSVSCNWDITKIWKDIVDAGYAYKRFYYMLQDPKGQTYVTIIFKISKTVISFYAVDMFLGLSVPDNVRVFFSIPNETTPSLSWSFLMTCGIDSWKFLRDENSQKPIEMSIQSLLQHCDKDGKLKMTVQVKSS